MFVEVAQRYRYSCVIGLTIMAAYGIDKWRFKDIIDKLNILKAFEKWINVKVWPTIMGPPGISKKSGSAPNS